MYELCKEVKKCQEYGDKNNSIIQLDLNFDEETGDTLISGRELHEKLKISSNYTTWFKRMIEYGFTKDVDFTEVWSDSKNGNAVDFEKSAQYMSSKGYIINHIMKLDMAKEIAMIQRSPEGKAIRQYLIQVEKDWNSPEKILSRALIIAKNNINKLKIENEELKPKALFHDAVTETDDCISLSEMSKLLKQNEIDIGRNRFCEWLRDNGYLIKYGKDYNMPTQKSMNLEIMKIDEQPNNYGGLWRNAKITGKGQVYFINKFLKN